MEELDLLKKAWNKSENYPRVTEEKIYAILHKNSSSAVKWIFIISIIEFTFGILLGLIMSITKKNEESIKLIKEIGLLPFYQISSLLMYSVILFFIVKFYLLYKKVSVTDSVQSLMLNILNARKVVRNYIIFNLVSGGIFLVTIFGYVLNSSIQKASLETHKHISTGIYILSMLAVVVIVAVILFVFWLIYRLLYGFLLNRLKKNYNELQKIDY